MNLPSYHDRRTPENTRTSRRYGFGAGSSAKSRSEGGYITDDRPSREVGMCRSLRRLDCEKDRKRAHKNRHRTSSRSTSCMQYCIFAGIQTLRVGLVSQLTGILPWNEVPPWYDR